MRIKNTSKNRLYSISIHSYTKKDVKLHIKWPPNYEQMTFDKPHISRVLKVEFAHRQIVLHVIIRVMNTINARPP